MMETEAEYSFTANQSDTTAKRNQTLPKLSTDEIKRGTILGVGSFCKIKSVETVCLNNDVEIIDDNNNAQQSARLNLAFKYEDHWLSPNPAYLQIWGRQESDSSLRLKGPPPRLVCKELKEGLSKTSKKRAMDDLKIELDILTSICEEDGHPNIIEIYAVGVDEIQQFETNITNPKFLILERIRTTLSSKIVHWRERKGLGVYLFLGIDKTAFRELWLERILAIRNIVDAIRFLHSKNIIYRDLKPDNIGFTDDNVAKIFDFGLAKMIDDSVEKINNAYKLTGETGTLRYMPIEVAKNKPYGFKADIYSLGILINEILTLKVPYAHIPPSQFRISVFEQGQRPSIPNGWPSDLRQMLEFMVDESPSIRPTAADVCKMLEGMLRGHDDDLFPSYM